MGNQGGKDDGKVSNDIEKKMQEANKNQQASPALLLLGAGESGKTTLLRQMRHIWGKQFQFQERQLYKRTIWENILECIQSACNQSKKLCEQYPDCKTEEKNEEILQHVLSINRNNFQLFDDELCETFLTLWADPGIQHTLTHRDKFYIMDSCDYFFANLKKFVGEDYCPTFDEICHSRVRTIGIKKEAFIVNNIPFTVFDVGGQKSERRKWLQVVDNVTAIIYVCSLAGYPQVIFEDNASNRLVESFNVYQEYVNHKAFVKINIILFLNKSDLFDEMIKTIPFTMCPVQDYKGDANDKDAVIRYITDVFKKRTIGYDTRQRGIYPHITCATNTENIKFVFIDVQHIVMQHHLKAGAILN